MSGGGGLKRPRPTLGCSAIGEEAGVMSASRVPSTDTVSKLVTETNFLLRCTRHRMLQPKPCYRPFRFKSLTALLRIVFWVINYKKGHVDSIRRQQDRKSAASTSTNCQVGCSFGVLSFLVKLDTYTF